MCAKETLHIDTMLHRWFSTDTQLMTLSTILCRFCKILALNVQQCVMFLVWWWRWWWWRWVLLRMEHLFVYEKIEKNAFHSTCSLYHHHYHSYFLLLLHSQKIETYKVFFFSLGTRATMSLLCGTWHYVSVLKSWSCMDIREQNSTLSLSQRLSICKLKESWRDHLIKTVPDIKT